MRIGKSRLNLTAGIRLSKNIFFGDGISGALAGRGIFGTTSQALAISPQFAQGAATFGTTSAAQLPYLAQGSNTFGADHSATASSATFLLDEYPGAAAAYSVRLLSSTYSGALVRIRRANDNSEEDFYPDSNNELSLNSETNGGTSLSSWIGSENGFITTWYDQSGNTNDSTQSTAANQPQIINAGILITDNSKAAISYTTGSQELTLSLAMTTTHSVFTVNHFNARGKEIIGASGRYLIYQDASNTYYRIDTTFRDFGATITNNQQLLYIDRKNTNVSLFENGAQIGTTVAAANSNTITSLSGEGAGFNFTGKMQEIIIYTSDKSSDKGGIESNINNFYSIY